MAFRGELKLSGFKELAKQMEELTPKVNNKIMGDALRAGAKIVRQQAIANAPLSDGLLKASIKVRTAPARRKNKTYVYVQTKEGDFKGKEFYGAFVEYGTGERFHKSGKSVGRIVANPFFENAFEMRKGEAERVIVDTLTAGIMEAMR